MQLPRTVVPGQILVLSSTPAFSEEVNPMTTVVLKSLRQCLSKMAETNAALERMKTATQLEIVIAQNGQKVQLSEPSLLSLNMRKFG